MIISLGHTLKDLNIYSYKVCIADGIVYTADIMIVRGNRLIYGCASKICIWRNLRWIKINGELMRIDTPERYDIMKNKFETIFALEKLEQ